MQYLSTATLRHTIVRLAAATAIVLGGFMPAFAADEQPADSVEAAIESLRAAVRRSPRSADANLRLGSALFEAGRLEEAREPLATAARRGATDAYGLLARLALADYDPDAASEHLDSWRSRLSRNRRPVPDELEALGTQTVQMRNMLARVERIEILDSIVVPRNEFFAAYRLSSQAGRILPADAVDRRIGADAATLPAYMPENGSELLWAATDSAGVYELYGADILDDGTPDGAGPLDSALGQGGNAAYPFLMPDGMTLYFAADGEGSLGGYDIFMTRRDDGDNGTEYFQPQNVGMPYNSPFDDYMLAIDEVSGLGWWATDRNQIADSVTVYVFVPSAMRINVAADDPNLKSLARIDNIALTQRPDTDASAVLSERMPARREHGTRGGTTSFVLDMGDGRVFTSLDDFSNPQARSAMVELLSAEAALRRHLEKVDKLRGRYAGGDRSVASEILSGEAESARMRRDIASARNRVIRSELR